MNIQFTKEQMIFRKDFNDKPNYTLSISKKNADGNYENGYIVCKFRSGTDIPNQTKIKVNSAFLTFYNTKEGDKVKTTPYVFINDFDLVGDNTKETDLPF